MEAPKEENYHQAQGEWGKSTPWWCPKKFWNPPKKSSLLSLVTKLSKLKTCRWNFDMFGGFLQGSGWKLQSVPRRASPIQLKPGSVRHALTSLVVIGFVCLNGRKFSSTARRLFFLFTDSPFPNKFDLISCCLFFCHILSQLNSHVHPTWVSERPGQQQRPESIWSSARNREMPRCFRLRGGF